MALYIPVYDLTVYDGTNGAELDLTPWLEAYGPSTGHKTEANGKITITWPLIPGAGSMEINTGDALRADGVIVLAADLAANYLPASQVPNL